MEILQPPVQRPSLDLIEKIFGSEVKDYVKRKNIGGESGQKGVLYEDIFAAHQIAKLTKRYFEAGENPRVEGQVCGFVDDFVVTYWSDLRQKAYQLKNSPSVSWSAGDHPIQTDFECQYALASGMGYHDIELGLVTSSNQCAINLSPAPQSINTYSAAYFFPYDEVIHQLLSQYPELRDDFGFLARVENYSLVECDAVASLLISAWITGGRKGSIVSVIQRARSLSPTMIRTLKTDAEARQRVDEDVRRILDRIPGFTYSISRGFLTWSAFDTDNGVLSYDCFDARFEQFQATVKKNCPRTFDDIEGWLI